MPDTLLALYHPNLSLRTILFCEKDLTNPGSKLPGIDWGGAQILPLIFTAHFPDLMPTIDYPYEKQDHCHPDEDWQTVPHDSPWRYIS